MFCKQMLKIEKKIKIKIFFRFKINKFINIFFNFYEKNI